MSNAVLRPSAIYLDGKKIATLSGSTFDLASNDQRSLVLDGYLGHSDGITTSDVEVKTITPYGDTTVDQIMNLILNKRYCELQATLGSKLISFTSRCISVSFSSEVENGRLDGTFKFEGGEPTYV